MYNAGIINSIYYILYIKYDFIRFVQYTWVFIEALLKRSNSLIAMVKSILSDVSIKLVKQRAT